MRDRFYWYVVLFLLCYCTGRLCQNEGCVGGCATNTLSEAWSSGHARHLGRMSSATTAEVSKEFLRACQHGQLAEAKKLLAKYPAILQARSTSKGYTAMHYGAMGGSVRIACNSHLIRGNLGRLYF